MGKYDWITDDMFRTKLEELIETMSTSSLLAIPGVYELIAEDMNNEVIAELESDREIEEEENADEEEPEEMLDAE